MKIRLFLGLFLVLGAVTTSRGALASRAAEPAPIHVRIDATEAPRKILHSHLEIPAQPGKLSLHYPKWVPGEHSPTGPISDLGGLKMHAGDKTIDWQRDEADPYTLHLEVPAGAKSVEVDFDLLMSPSTAGFRSTAGATDKLAVIVWNQLVFYPKDAGGLKIPFQAQLRLPEGWQSGTALPVTESKDGVVKFAPVSLETLIDSPVLCGKYFREIPIGPENGLRHYLVLACDSSTGLELPAESKASLDRLVSECQALFGAHHYRSYRLLLALSDHLTPLGLEHHESSDNRLPERALIDEKMRKSLLSILPHEFVHSWNGKYRRPAEMITADYQQTQKTRLLWVYEGLTHYLMFTLTARSGFWTPEEARESLAGVAEGQNNHRGRNWRPLEDTTVAANMLHASRGWAARRRTADYYDEGILLWLEVDAMIRSRTKGAKTLDDFCRKFFGGASGPPEVKPYTFEELTAALNEVAPFDWHAHFKRRVAAPVESAPLDGITQSGWKLTYSDKPTKVGGLSEALGKSMNYASSLGLLIAQDGAVLDVIPDKPADQAKIGPGMKVIAVNEMRFTPERLREAVIEAKTTGTIDLLLQNGEAIRSFRVSYRDGLRHPHLERTSLDQADLLEEIIKPLGTEKR